MIATIETVDGEIQAQVECDLKFVGARDLHIGPTAVSKLRTLFGSGYGDRFFVLIGDGVRLEGCTLDSNATITFVTRS